MSQEELVAAYLDGRISRRTFVRRLVAAGVGVSAAIAYTHALRPAPAQAEHNLDHYEAPTVITTDATELGGESAHLNASVDPNRFSTSVYFELGPTASYGLTTPAETITGAGPQPVGALATGLDPGRVYHFRAVASNQIGQTAGADRTFVIPDTALPEIRISPIDTELATVNEAGAVRVLVSAGEAAEVELEASRRKRSRNGIKRIVVARGELSFDRAGDRVAELKLTNSGKRSLKNADKARLSVRADATDLAGNSSVSQARLRLS